MCEKVCVCGGGTAITPTFNALMGAIRNNVFDKHFNDVLTHFEK